MFFDRVIHFGKNLVDHGKGCSPKKLKSLIELTKVAHLRVQVVSFNMNLIFLRSVFLDKFIHFGKKNWRSGKGSFTEKVKFVDRGTICSAPESTVSKRDPSPSCPFRGNLGDQVKGRSPRKQKSFIEVPYVAYLKVQVLSFNMNLIFSP